MTFLENLPWKAPLIPAGTSALLPPLPVLLRETPVYPVAWTGPELEVSVLRSPG